MQNPIKTAVQSRISGTLGAAFFGLGLFGPIGQAIMAVSVAVGAVMFGIHQYQLIVITNAEMEAARFDAQSVLAVNHLTPQQAAANLQAGMVINGLDGKPVVGKSLEALAAYLSAQAKANADSAEAQAKTMTYGEAKNRQRNGGMPPVQEMIEHAQRCVDAIKLSPRERDALDKENIATGWPPCPK